MTDKSDDEISLTSTTPSEQLSEYEVESVLSELEAPDGQLKYLVKWRGYPIERCSWEPADSFNTPETLADWAKTKRAIEEGRRQPFDLIRWENHVLALEEASKERKRKRAAKKRRLGLPRRPTEIVGNERRTSDVPLTGSRSDPVSQRVTKATSTLDTQPVPSLQSKPPKPAPPPILFGNASEKRPQTARKVSNADPNNRFNLSTRWRYEKAKRDERAPNIDQLDLVPPSKWTPMSNANAAKIGPYKDQTTVEAETLTNTGRRPENDETESPAGPWAADFRRDTRRGDETFNQAPMDADRPSRFRDSRFDTRRGDEVSSWTPTEADRPDRFRDSRSDRPLEPSREPRGKYLIASDGVKRFIDPGDLLITMRYGPLKTLVGNVRLVGLSAHSRKNILSCKKDDEVDLWFQYLCSLDEYDRLCQNVSRM